MFYLFLSLLLFLNSSARVRGTFLSHSQFLQATNTDKRFLHHSDTHSESSPRVTSVTTIIPALGSSGPSYRFKVIVFDTEKTQADFVQNFRSSEVLISDKAPRRVGVMERVGTTKSEDQEKSEVQDSWILQESWKSPAGDARRKTATSSFYLFVYLYFKSETLEDRAVRDEFLAGIKDFQRYVHESEPNTLQFEIAVSEKDQFKVVVIEQYQDKESDYLQTHRHSEAFLEWKKRMKTWREQGHIQKVDGESFQTV